MTQENLQDALGYLDDDMIAAVEERRQQRDQQTDISTAAKHISSVGNDITSDAIFSSFRKKIMRREFMKWGSLAASVCVLIGVVWIWSTGMGNFSADSSVESDKYYSKQENMEIIVEDNLNAGSSNTKPQEGIPEFDDIEETYPFEDKTQPETAPVLNPMNPPILHIVNEAESMQAMSGNYSWSWEKEDGTTEHVIACGMHPLDCEDSIGRMITNTSTVQLRFTNTASSPDEITIECWNEKYWGDSLVEGEAVTISGDQIQLKPGGYIYSLTAKWTHGTVDYAFYIYYE